MKALVRSFSELTQEALAGWNRFWFTPQTPYTLAFMRILVGLMLFYTHLVWALDLTSFLGSESWVSRPAWDAVNVDAYVWSYLWLVQSPAILWVIACRSFVRLCPANHWLSGSFDGGLGLVYCDQLLPPFDRRPVWPGPN